MDASFALEFEFKGRSQICVVDYDTDWIDVAAMIKCSLDLDDIEVKYIDDENDEVNVNSQDEYSLAKEQACKTGNTLKFIVYRRHNPAKTLNQTKKVKVVMDPHLDSRYDSITGCALPHFREDRVKDRNTLASITISPEIMDDTKRPPDKFVDNIVQDILQGLDGSVVVDEDTEEVRATQKKIRQGIKEKNQSSNIEWSPSCKRVPKQIPKPNDEFVNKVVKGVLSGLNGDELRRAMDAVRDQRRSERMIHDNIVCDNCSKAIIGIRYKCGHCADFDLCERCEGISSAHDENHVFLKIRKPAIGGLGLRFDGEPIPLIEIPVYPTDEGLEAWHQKKLRYVQKIAHKIAKAEMKYKRKEEKRKRKEMGVVQVSPTKREKLEINLDMDGMEQFENVCKVSNEERKGLLKDWTRKLNALLLGDVNFHEGTHLQPGTKFTKSWRIMNAGDVPFDGATNLKFLWGNIPTLSDDPVPVTTLNPGQEGIISVECEAPRYPGTYQSAWRLERDGHQFGQRLTCNIIVDKAEILEPKEDKLPSIKDEMLDEITKVQETSMRRNVFDSLPADFGSLPVNQDQSSTEKVAMYFKEFHGLSDPKKEMNSPVSVQTIAASQGLLPPSPPPQLQTESSLEACDAVANLQSDQSDSCSLNKIISNNTDLLTAQDILSFEMLKISKKQEEDEDDVENEVQAVPTPNNTPCGMTPCMSPVPQLDAESLSSKMSSDGGLMVEEPTTDNEAELSSDETDMVIIKPRAEENISDSSSDESLLEDFYVVPLPDCFDLNKPLEECVLSNSTMTDLEEASADISIEGDVISEVASLDHLPDIDTMLATSHTLIQTPMIPLVTARPIQPLAEIDPHTIVPQGSTFSAPEIVLDVVNASEDDGERGFVVSPDQEGAASPVVESLDHNIAKEMTEVTPLVTEEQETLFEPNEEEVNPTDVKETVPVAVEQDIPGYQETNVDVADVFHDAEDHAREDNVHAPQEEGAEIPRENRWRAPADEPDDVLLQGHDQAREILGYTAARAAEVASSVMRMTYDAANTAVSALLTPPAPPPTNVRPSPMATLIDMGFANRDLNRDLLYKYNNDVNQCVQELLSDEVENWHLSRH